MMNDNLADNPSTPAVDEKDTQVTPPEGDQKPTEPSQDNPVKQELEKIQSRTQGRTKREKLEYTRRRIENELRELDEVEGVKPEPLEDDSAPVTVGMLKKINQGETVKTALSLAEEIEDENDRELTKYHLTNTIRSSGNAREDLRNAKLIVNSVKNSRIAEELGRKPSPKQFSSAPGSPARTEEIFEPTAEEKMYMSPPWNMTREDIIKARRASAK